MTKEMMLKAFEMRLDGASYQKIADKLEVDKQTINKRLHSVLSTPNYKCDTVYPALKDWINENGINKTRFAMLCLQDRAANLSYSSLCTWAKKRLTGEIAFTSAEWLRLAEITGLPLEQLMDSNGAIKLEHRTRKNKES